LSSAVKAIFPSYTMARMEPWCPSAIERAIERPMPKPQRARAGNLDFHQHIAAGQRDRRAVVAEAKVDARVAPP